MLAGAFASRCSSSNHTIKIMNMISDLLSMNMTFFWHKTPFSKGTIMVTQHSKTFIKMGENGTNQFLVKRNDFFWTSIMQTMKCALTYRVTQIRSCNFKWMYFWNYAFLTLCSKDQNWFEEWRIFFGNCKQTAENCKQAAEN